MPELSELLRTIEPARTPGFDVEDVRDRVDARARRRRTVGAVTLGLVALLTAGVVLPQLLDRSEPGAVLDPTAATEPAEPARSTDDPIDAAMAGLEPLIQRSRDAGYEPVVSFGDATVVSFTPTDPSLTVAHAIVTDTPGPGSVEDLADRGGVATMYGFPVTATEHGEPLVDCGPHRLAGSAASAGDDLSGTSRRPTDADARAFERLVERMDCTPLYLVDPNTSDAGAVGVDDPVSVDRLNDREEELLDAFAALGVADVAGEPSHGGTGASMGIEWEGALVHVYADDRLYDRPEILRGQIVTLAGGQADLGDGDGLPRISFDCEGTNYQLTHDSSVDDVHVRAAEALVGVLGCTPTVAG